ncbi:MAG: branched-chain amino acid ABC transporter permease, partial [Pseudorhodoplanes sp.]
HLQATLKIDWEPTCLFVLPNKRPAGRNADTRGKLKKERSRVSSLMATFVALAVDGIGYGMILFLISVGLTVTLGVMRIANLAHCGFAMIGGYLALFLVSSLKFDFFSALFFATIATMVIGALLERTFYRWVYATGDLGQIMMTIGLTFVMIATINLIFGSYANTISPPRWLSTTTEFGAITISTYRVFIVFVSVMLAATLWGILEYTAFGAKLRASVDNPRMARCVGIDVQHMFAFTFTIGCGLAAAAGILGTQFLPLEPWYALVYLVPVLMVVAVGGLGSLKGSFYAALAIGILDTFGRYLFPNAGGFFIYAVVLAVLVWRPQGLYGRA